MYLKILFAFIFILAAGFTNAVVINFNVFNSIPSQHYQNNSDQPDSVFIIGAMNCGENIDYTYIDSLYINVWHKYTNDRDSWIGIDEDKVWNNISDYSGKISERINENIKRGYLTFYDRPKIHHLAYGQRSKYQFEKLDSNDVYPWFYSYAVNETGGETVVDNGKSVIHCKPGALNNKAGWLAKGLFSNREQSYGFWANDSLYDWYIKPSFKILPFIAQKEPNKRVCRIDITRWDSTLVDSITIYAGNFRKDSSPDSYSGDYINEFLYRNGKTRTAIIIPAKTFKSPVHATTYSWGNSCGIDFRVWWYGETELWADEMTVDDKVAHDMFTPGDMHETFEKWIKEETELALINNISNFYIEEFELNTVPCIRYVNERINYYSNGKLSLCFNTNDAILRSNIPFGNHNRVVKPEFYYNFIYHNQNTKYLITTNYPLHGMNVIPWNPVTRIPNTMPSGKCTYLSLPGVLANSIDPILYDDSLQVYLDQNYDNIWNFVNLLKRDKDLSILLGIPFTPMLQTHLWHEKSSNGIYRLREPTNEELTLMGNLAIAYGAKGILWFWGGKSWGDYINQPEGDYAFGLFNNDLKPRHDNVYHQWTGNSGIYRSSKFNTIRDLNRLYRDSWGKYLTSFNTGLTNSYIYRIERDELIKNTYISDIYTLSKSKYSTDCKQDYPGIKITGDIVTECPEKRYIQASLFKKSANENDNYFFIVNRRCSPLQPDNNDGRRYIIVSIDKNKDNLPLYASWDVIEISTGKIVAKINKAGNKNLLDLGWFMPGEGKLYMIKPSE